MRAATTGRLDKRKKTEESPSDVDTDRAIVFNRGYTKNRSQNGDTSDCGRVSNPTGGGNSKMVRIKMATTDSTTPNLTLASDMIMKLKLPPALHQEILEIPFPN